MIGVFLAGCLYAATGAAVAGPSNVQFSAEAVQSAQDNKTRHSRIFVGDNRIRLEYQQDDQTMVEIYDMHNQRALLLMPKQASYMERKLPPGGISNPMLPPTESNPCARIPNAQCKQLAKEALYGRPVVKWEMVIEQPDKEQEPLRSLHWIDTERHMQLRTHWPDGTLSEMRLLGQQTLNGRVTERWEVVTRRKDGESMTSTQWYDPQLQIAFRVEGRGVYFRELRNIRLARQPDQLFTVPAGYKLTTPQQQQKGVTGVSPQQRAPQQTAPRQAAPQQSAPQQSAPQQRSPYPAGQYPGR